MSLNKPRIGLLAVSVATSMGNMTSASAGSRASASLHGNVNVLLGGAMLTGVILVVFLICYCCHRNMRKNASRHAQYWHEEPELPLEVFTVDGQCYEVAGVFLSSDSCASFDTFTCAETPSPPPAYDAVIKAAKMKEMDADVEKNAVIEKIDDNAGLPSYEAAVRLEAHGYV